MPSVVLLVYFPDGTVQGGGILRGDLGGRSGVSRGWRGGKGAWERNVRERAEMLKGMEYGCDVYLFSFVSL